MDIVLLKQDCLYAARRDATVVRVTGMLYANRVLYLLHIDKSFKISPVINLS
jgi:hypothetical protein